MLNTRSSPLYPLDDRALLRTNQLNAVGLLAVLLGTSLLPRIRSGFSRPASSSLAHNPWRVALLFLAIGVPVKYLLGLPYMLGLTDYVVPGSILSLDRLSGLAIVPLAIAAGKSRRGARMLLVALIAAELIVGFVMLAKLRIIETVLLVFLGQFAVRPNIKCFVVTGLIVAVGYVAILVPFVGFGRIILGRASAHDVWELRAVARSYASEGRETVSSVLPGVQGWWARLAYANTQAFAMDQYDEGKPGGTFALVRYFLVPRLLYRDKPVMTPGHDFDYLLRGSGESSTGLGFVGEAYWNGGWLLVVLAGLYVGGLFAVLGRFSARVIRSRRWLFVPLVFMTIYLGLRPDDWFVSTY